MNTNIEISVIMSVYNDANLIEKSIESILQQKHVNFEFIIINDGSTDSSTRILQKYADEDSRIIIITQENQGLTVALANGCAQAKGRYIARQDTGDQSLPNKLHKQASLLKNNLTVSFVSCGTRFIGPKGEFLYDVIQTTSELKKGLEAVDLKFYLGPSSHGSVMFKRNIYETVGGYRKLFRVAQDTDLWLRLIEKGPVLTSSEILYIADVTPGTVSSANKQLQFKTTKLILECAKYRRLGINENEILEKVKQLKYSREKATPYQIAETYYFIGMILRKNNNKQCNKYYQQALLKYPLHIKSLFRLIEQTIKG